jgi:hypothetical protein
MSLPLNFMTATSHDRGTVFTSSFASRLMFLPYTKIKGLSFTLQLFCSDALYVIGFEYSHSQGYVFAVS